MFVFGGFCKFFTEATGLLSTTGALPAPEPGITIVDCAYFLNDGAMPLNVIEMAIKNALPTEEKPPLVFISSIPTELNFLITEGQYEGCDLFVREDAPEKIVVMITAPGHFNVE
ncbi:MAG: hypothetical protein WCG48_02490 [Candidatus Berkelbacteria bacterium]